MSFLTKKMTWSNAEFIPFKVCIAAAYLFIGSTFPAFFSPFKWVVFGLFIATLIIVMTLWVKKMRACLLPDTEPTKDRT